MTEERIQQILEVVEKIKFNRYRMGVLDAAVCACPTCHRYIEEAILEATELDIILVATLIA